MKKIETIWHEILQEALNKAIFRHTQQEIAEKLGFSLSTVNHALNVPTQIGAIRKESKFFVLEDFKKLLLYWASMRNLARDIIYTTQVDLPILEIEGRAIPESIFAGYSAARHLLGESPADYSAVYFYIKPDSLPQFQERFPLNNKAAPNVFALKAPKNLSYSQEGTTLVQTYVDIWNLKTWYAKDFLRALEKKIYSNLGIPAEEWY